ncbi:MAG: hypothetical protein KBT40_07740 [bacterium]|nr:hypothetical protein [Candidatus Minthenecus merdequi]
MKKKRPNNRITIFFPEGKVETLHIYASWKALTSDEKVSVSSLLSSTILEVIENDRAFRSFIETYPAKKKR